MRQSYSVSRRVLISLFLLLCLNVSQTSFATESEKTFELGVSFGDPGAVNFLFGLWKPFSSPILFRVYGIALLLVNTGAIDLGIVVDDDPPLKQYVVGTFGVFTAYETNSMTYLGVKYGIKYQAFFADLGLGWMNRPIGYPLRVGHEKLILVNLGFAWGL